jgi:signal transduction histidine kinase
MNLRRFSARPPLVDAVIAAVLVVLAEAEAAFEAVSVPRWVDGLVVLGFTVPLAWRRQAPVTVLVIAVISVLLYGEIETSGAHQTLILSLALASFTVGYELPRPRAWLGPGVLVAGLLLSSLALGQPAGDTVVAAVLYGAPWAFGQAMRNRGQRLDEVAARAERAELDREQREREAVEAERARIARELHDVVSHSISVVAIQAQAIRQRLGPEHAREASDLTGIETTARQAMAEMRRLLGVLRADGERLPLAPQPGLDQLPELVERARETGLQVELDIDGASTPLPPGVDLAAFRIVQEALTNALKHAAAQTVRVRVHYRKHDLELIVEDDGAGMDAQPGDGHGLFGMRERVALYGGACTIGSREGGGVRVHALLPVQEGGPA